MKLPVAAALDVVGIGVFAAVGRSSHAESFTLVGVASTAWPFLIGAVVGAVVTRYARRPAALLPTGIGVWAGSVAGGMLLRTLTGAGVQVSFVIVASIALAILLLGWRAVHTLVTRTRRRPHTRVPT